jgi:hypothetical protein
MKNYIVQLFDKKYQDWWTIGTFTDKSIAKEIYNLKKADGEVRILILTKMKID